MNRRNREQNGFSEREDRIAAVISKLTTNE